MLTREGGEDGERGSFKGLPRNLASLVDRPISAKLELLERTESLGGEASDVPRDRQKVGQEPGPWP